MNVTRLRSLCIEIFKTLNSINPTFMNDIFELRKTNRAIRNQYKPNLEVPIINQVNLGAKSIRYLGPEIWNTLPFHIKSSESLTTFKRIIKNFWIQSHANSLFVSGKLRLLCNDTCLISMQPRIHKFSWLI